MVRWCDCCLKTDYNSDTGISLPIGRRFTQIDRRRFIHDTMRTIYGGEGGRITVIKLTKTKDEIIQKSNELAIQYEAKYRGCGQCTFLAIVDALRWGGLEIMPKDMEDRFFPGICVLTGGVGLSGDGTCAAVASGALAIGLALGMQRETFNEARFRENCAIVRNTLLSRYYKKYNSLLCKDIQRKFFGKAWDLTRDDTGAEFLGITEGCVIMETAMSATEIILDEFEKGNVKGYVDHSEAKS
jgi:hypothetical protein